MKRRIIPVYLDIKYYIAVGLLIVIITAITIISRFILQYEIVDVEGDMIVYRVKSDQCKEYGRYCDIGLMNKSGEVYTKAIYEDIDILDHLIVLEGNDKVLVLNKDNPNNVILKKKENIKDIHVYDDYVIVKTWKDTDYLINDGKSVSVTTLEDKWHYYFSDNYLLFNNDYVVARNYKEGYGYFDKTGKTIIEPYYDIAYQFTVDGLAKVIVNDKKGVIDINGNIVIDTVYDNLTMEPSYDLIRVLVDGQYGFIDYYGNTVISIEYDHLDLIKHGNIIASKNSKKGILNVDGDVVVNFIYDNIRYLEEEGLYLVSNDDTYQLIDETGKIVKDIPYDEVYIPHWYVSNVSRLIEVSNGEKWGAIDLEGNIIIPIAYDELYAYPKIELYKVRQNDQWSLFDYEGNAITEFAYDEIVAYYDDQWIKVRNASLWGYVDQEGNPVTDIKYTELNNRVVTSSHLNGLVDESGELIIETKYQDISWFNDDYIIARDSGKYGLIDMDDEIMVKFKYDEIRMVNQTNQLMIAKLDGKYGVIDLDGDTIVKFKYNKIVFEDDTFYLEKAGKIYRSTLEGDIEKIKGRDLGFK